MEALPKDLSCLPFNDSISGMVDKEECQYLFWIAREMRNREGVIAEVGSWLGRSAWHLAKGAARTIHCFDDFKWRRDFSEKCDINLPVNACFQHIFDNNMKETKAVSHKVSISDLTWELGDINILHVDAAKRAPEISFLLTSVGEYLRPGSVIILQDYCHEMSHDLPFAVELLREYLEPLHSPAGSMVSFRVRRPIPPDAVFLERLSPSSYNFGEIRDIWSGLLKSFDGTDHKRLSAALAFLLAERGYPWRALWRIALSGMRRKKLKSMLSPDKYARYPSILAVYGFWPTMAMFQEFRKRRSRKSS